VPCRWCKEWAVINCSTKETVAKVSKLVDKEHQLTLKLMEDQLCINWEEIC
jgi:hypothetical protein